MTVLNQWTCRTPFYLSCWLYIFQLDVWCRFWRVLSAHVMSSTLKMDTLPSPLYTAHAFDPVRDYLSRSRSSRCPGSRSASSPQIPLKPVRNFTWTPPVPPRKYLSVCTAKWDEERENGNFQRNHGYRASIATTREYACTKRRVPPPSPTLSECTRLSNDKRGEPPPPPYVSAFWNTRRNPANCDPDTVSENGMAPLREGQCYLFCLYILRWTTRWHKEFHFSIRWAKSGQMFISVREMEEDWKKLKIKHDLGQI